MTGTVIQGLIFENHASYTAPNWQGTLLVIANISILVIFNIWGSRIIPLLQNGLLAFHVIVLVGVVVPLWVLAPHASTTDVFATFYNGGQWSSIGLSLFVGQISAIWGCIGSDAAAHMAEEVKDAGVSVAQAMFWSYTTNAAMGILLVITVCFAIPDLDAALNDDSGYPFLWVFRNGLGGPAPTILTSGILVLIFASNVSYLASTARETFAFARDKGFPFSSWLGHIDEALGIPKNALLFSAGFSMALSLINIGSDTAFNAIISVNTSSLMLSYTLSIGCVLWRRLNCPATLPPARWSLGRLGLPINAAGMLYTLWAFFWSFWPSNSFYEADLFNWAPVVFGAVTVYGAVDFWFRGRHVYRGPVTLVEGRREPSTTR